MKKKRIPVLIVIGSLLLFSFQVLNNKLHLLQSPGAVIEDYVEPDYGLSSGHIDSLIPYATRFAYGMERMAGIP